MDKFLPGYRSSCIAPSANLKEALATIGLSGAMLACIVDQDSRLIAILTDSDVRKALLQGATLLDPVMTWANSAPTVVLEVSSPAEIFTLARETEKRELPVVDHEGRLVDIFVLGVFETRRSPSNGSDNEWEAAGAGLENWAFILAGGLGTRLRSVVPDRPKPLAQVNEKTLIQILMENLQRNGFRKFYVSLNYMGGMIEDHITELVAGTDIQVEFIREHKRLGTAGSLGLIEGGIDCPILVCNADILTRAPYKQIISEHIASGAHITCVTREHLVEVPFGVLQVGDKGAVKIIQEKPEMRFLVNAGIYILSPQVFSLISKSEYLDMPELINTAIMKGFRVLPFFIHEYWLDVGRPEDFERANQEWDRHDECR